MKSTFKFGALALAAAISLTACDKGGSAGGKAASAASAPAASASSGADAAGIAPTTVGYALGLQLTDFITGNFTKHGVKFDNAYLLENMKAVAEGKQPSFGQDVVAKLSGEIPAIMQQASSGTPPKFTPEQLKNLSGVLGAQIGSGFLNAKQAKVNLDLDSFVTAVTDSLEKKKTQMSIEQAGQTLQAVEERFAKQNRDQGEAFLKENKSKEGVKTTASGLQYKVTKEGTGKQPKATDEVSVSYVGRLVDGTEFDSSQGKPVSFPLNGVIKGWTEGLQLMKEGGEATFYIPADLAYGKNPPPQSPILPDSVLVFDVKLEKVGK